MTLKSDSPNANVSEMNCGSSFWPPELEKMSSRLNRDARVIGVMCIVVALVLSLAVLYSVHSANVLQQRLDRSEAILNQLPSGIAYINARTWRIVDAKPGLCDISGYSRRELIGMSLFTLIPERVEAVHADMREDWHGTWQMMLGKDKRHNTSARLVRKDGSLVSMQMDVDPDIIGGVQSYTLFIDATSVTEQPQ